MLSDPDGYKMTNELAVISDFFDKRIELKNLIERINAGDKYSWFLKKKINYFKFKLDYLKIFIKKNYYSGKLNSDSDSNSVSCTNSNFSEEEGIVLFCSYYMNWNFKVYWKNIAVIKWYNKISTWNNR